MSAAGRDRLNRLYESLWDIAAADDASLDQSLQPRSWDYPFHLLASWGVAPSWSILDAGCGRGLHTVELARRFGCRAVGVDLVPAPLRAAMQALAVEGGGDAVAYAGASVECLPFRAEAFHLVWCRDMLVHVAGLRDALCEFARVLKPDGSALLFVTLETALLEPLERGRLCAALELSPDSLRRERFEAAFRDAELYVASEEVVGGELMEFYEERDGRASRELMRLARMRRLRERLTGEWGETRYRVTEALYLWHIYQLLGKLSPAIFRLRKAVTQR